jgi:hypothetical protein
MPSSRSESTQTMVTLVSKDSIRQGWATPPETANHTHHLIYSHLLSNRESRLTPQLFANQQISKQDAAVPYYVNGLQLYPHNACQLSTLWFGRGFLRSKLYYLLLRLQAIPHPSHERTFL